MAPRLPKDLRADINSVNEQLQGISEKMANISELGQNFRINVGSVDDLAMKIGRIGALNEKWAKTVEARVNNEKHFKDALISTARQIVTNQKKHDSALKSFEKIDKRIQASAKAGIAISQKDADLWKKKQKVAQTHGETLLSLKKKYDGNADALESMDSHTVMIAKLIGNEILGGVDKLGKAIASIGIDSVFATLNLIKGGVERIYDLVQRTTKATGEFNESLGGTTKELGALQKEGWQLEGALRGLGDFALGIGLKELKDATSSFGFADERLSKFRITAVLAGKAMGIGSSAAGELARTFKLLGTSQGSIAGNFVEISDAAGRAGVPVADFAKEVVSSKNFLASFGKVGRKVFLESAAYAKRLGISIAALEKFTDMTDTFESTAEAAAKMNTVFGTSINSLELMLEQDPAKRLEMVRKQFKEQGKTFEGMSRQERKFFAQTMSLTEEEAAAVLDQGITLDEFNKKREKSARSEAQAQKEIQRGMMKTISTLNNWSLTFDNITKAFAPLLKDITDFLGITVKIDEHTGLVAADWKSFGQRVEQVVGRIRTFFKMIGENEAVRDLIGEITSDFKGLFSAFVDKGPEGTKNMQKLVKFIGQGATFARKFYDAGKYLFTTIFTRENIDRGLTIFKFITDNAGTILAVIGALKLFAGAATVFSGISAFLNVAGMLGGGKAFTQVIGAFTSSLGTFTNSLGPAASALGKAGLVGAAALAGWQLGKFIGSLDVAGKSIDDWTVDMWGFVDKIREKVDKKLGFQSDYNDKFTAVGLTGAMQADMMYKELKEFNKGKGELHNLDAMMKASSVLAEYSGREFDKAKVEELINKQKSINTAAREAARTLVAGAPVSPAVTSPGKPSEPIATNFADKAKKGKTGTGDVKIIAGDVFLDGNLVGRHMGRLAYEE